MICKCNASSASSMVDASKCPCGWEHAANDFQHQSNELIEMVALYFVGELFLKCHARASAETSQGEREGILRGHIGLIEEALDRLEGKVTEEDRGKKM